MVKKTQFFSKENIFFAGMALVCFWVFYDPFAYMVASWMAKISSSYTPGPFVPIVSAYMVWSKRELLKKLTKTPTYWGLMLIIPALIIHIFAQVGDLHRISVVAFVLLLLGSALFFWGRKVATQLVFPCFFLLFMVPMEFLDGMFGVKLRIMASEWAGAILDLLGFEIIRIGTQIEIIDIFMFDVAAPCSGLKSLVALCALGCAFAYLTQNKNWKRIVIISSTIPIAIFANVFRIVMIGLIAVSFGKETAMGFFHMFSGFFIFTFALFALSILGRLLSLNIKNK